MKVIEEVEQTVRMIGLFSLSSGSAELCRRLSTDELFGKGTVGVQIYSLENNGHWHLLGSFGKNPHHNQDLSLLDSSLLTRTAQTREIAIDTRDIEGTELDVWACVAIRSDLAVGAIVRTSTKEGFIFRPVNGTLKAVQDSAGLFLAATHQLAENMIPENLSLEVQELSHRQLAVLLGMAWGKTNIAIAQDLILSESTIKQETVKIYKALGVGNRRQAVLKAQNLNLLPKDIALLPQILKLGLKPNDTI